MGQQHVSEGASILMKGEIGGWDPVANWDVRSGATVWLRENPHMDGSL